MQLSAKSRVVARDQRLNGTRAHLQESINTSAFVGTNPTGELITSGLPVTREQSRKIIGCEDDVLAGRDESSTGYLLLSRLGTGITAVLRPPLSLVGVGVFPQR